LFDNNSKVLKDIYAPVPIVRAGTIDGRPGGIDSDYAAYFNDAGNVVGYRDLVGNFYDTDGSRIDAAEIVDSRSGQVSPTGAPVSEAFEDYDPEVTIMPRIGVSFPVTDQAVFFASYNVTSQRPTEREFAPFRAYEEITTQNSRTANPRLEPEVTTQYELGFRQRLTSTAALTISGFYRTQENKISNRRLIGGFPSYGTYLNADFTTTKGVELGFDLRRTQNLAVTANYTLAYAQGTGSDSEATEVIVWRGQVFPNTIAPADFDQRHTVNASLDYRLGEDEGPVLFGAPVLENVGVNALIQYGSGQAYTALESAIFSINDSFTADAVGEVNSARLPASSRIDLRVDRRFNLGATALRAYVTVLNLLDSQNVLAVYRATGLPDEDGYLLTSGGSAFVRNQPDPDAAAFNYRSYIGGPVNVGDNHTSASGLMYSLPRRIRLGVQINF
jgi:outer membrane receptor protein involved in Fe transport